jgi:hypothetical protein
MQTTTPARRRSFSQSHALDLRRVLAEISARTAQFKGASMKAIFALLIAGAASCAQAQQSSILYTGQELLNRFNNDRLSALAYIAGVADSQSGVTVCIPPNTVTLGQMADMVKQSLDRVPSERHLAADVYVTVTLGNRWPCNNKRGGGV